MRGILLAFMAAALLPTPSLAGPFDGLWRSNPTSECVYTETGNGALKIEDDVLFGVDSRCQMTTPVNVRDMEAILYDMSCEAQEPPQDAVESNEAELVPTTWTDRAMFMTAADGGLYLIWNGFAFKYERCADNPAVGTVATAAEIGISDTLSPATNSD